MKNAHKDFQSNVLTNQQVIDFEHELIYFRRAYKSIKLTGLVSTSENKHELRLRNRNADLLVWSNLKLENMQELISAAIKHKIPTKIDFAEYRLIPHNKGKKKLNEQNKPKEEVISTKPVEPIKPHQSSQTLTLNRPKAV